LFDLDQVAIVLDEATHDLPVDEHSVAFRIVSANLAACAPQLTGIAHPVGEMMRHP
jgi:hypothetical protein